MSSKRWLLVFAILGVTVIGGAAVLLAVVLPRYVEQKVLSSAEAQGVTLEPRDIAFGWGFVQLTQVGVSLDRVRSVQMQVGRIDVALTGFTPLSIELKNVEGAVVGSLSNVSLELSAWTQAHPAAYGLPLSAKNVHVRFVEPAGTPPWLEVSNGELTRTASGGVFSAQHSHFLGVDLGKVGAGFTREASAISLGFGESDVTRAPFRVAVAPNAKPPTATFTLSPISAERLAKPLGIALPAPSVIVSSQASLAFAADSSVSGAISINLKGYIPPHPFELDGFIFGDTTTFDSKFALPPTRNRMTLSDSRVKAGSFELRGGGLLIRSSDHSEITMDLSGELPCNALARVEAQSRLSKILGSDLAGKAGSLAEKLTRGSVSVGLRLSANTRNIEAARIERKIGIGCGLHPLTLAELSRLVPLSPELNQLLKDLPALPTDLSKLPNLPALPSGLPPLPTLPSLPTGFGLPTLQVPSKNAAPTSTRRVSPPPATSAGN